MSSQTTFTKTKYLGQAVFIALMSASGSSYAFDFGETAIQSVQNEPLLATIEVKDISNAKDFKVSLANSAIYKQMGLTPDAGIRATFKQTSASTGKIILKSSKPISSPFADVVLNINDNNKKQFRPKTLLMPISEKHRVNVIADNAPHNLPHTSSMPKPEIVADNKGKANPQGIPHGEFAKATEQALKKDATVAKASASKEPAIGTLKTDALALNNLQASEKKESQAVKQEKQAKVVHKKSVDKKTTAHKKPVHKKATSKKITAKNNKAHTKRTHSAKHTKRTDSKVKYVVQRNDNLWTIANEIAKRSKVNVHTVMKRIQQNNPHAFVRGNARMLIADKTLTLPSYGKIPSQKSLEEAISARRASIVANKRKKKQATLVKSKRKNPVKKHKAKTVKKTTKTTKKADVVAKNKHHTKKPSTPKVVQQPKNAHVSLVAPNSSKSASKKSAGSMNKNPLVSKLKHSRLSAAHKITRVKRLNTKVSSYTKKLQLQNRKLAQLEARLKKLKGK